MLNRLTVSVLIKSIISVLAACIIFVLATGAWGSWTQLQTAERVSLIAEASSHAFKAMAALRADKVATVRTLNADGSMQPDYEKYVKDLRATEMQALRATIDLIGGLAFNGKDNLYPDAKRLTDQLASLQTESWDAMHKPKAERPATLARDYAANNDATLPLLENISAALSAAAKYNDPVIDQYLLIKQMAWLARNVSGDASTFVSTALANGKVPDGGLKTYNTYVAGTAMAWNAVEAAAAGAPLPPALTEALATAKQTLFDGNFLALRDRLINAVAEGTKPEMEANAWSPYAVKRMGTAVTVAERALDEARNRTQTQISLAQRSLALQLILLAIAAVVATGAVIAVTRRVTTPLHRIRDAMLKVAGGDLAVEAVYADRKDEIGALAGALETFKRQAIEKAEIERQERNRNAETLARQQAVEQYIGTFEVQIRDALSALGSASDQMNATSDGMAAVSNQTNTRVQEAARASHDASANVQNVAAAAEELSTSINDISRQASHAAGIASRAVNQARLTDNTVQGLAASASRIGEVVGLINDIASQTNLLALNATIEAARAGEAGRGFAVVASEVKSLASQTAKATEDISEQIADIQKVANEAIDAIKSIGGIIGEVNEVATAIAAAVEEQGAATQEITRSTQQAADGTRNVSDNITGVSADADAAGAAAQDVKAASQTLAGQTRQIGTEVSDFLGKIRAA